MIIYAHINMYNIDVGIQNLEECLINDMYPLIGSPLQQVLRLYKHYHVFRLP